MSLKDQLESKGFCILENVFSNNQVKEMKEKFIKCEEEVHRLCQENQADPYDFVQLHEKEIIIKMQSYCQESIIETAKGRYDVRIQMAKDEFKDVPEHPVIANLMKSCLKER